MKKQSKTLTDSQFQVLTTIERGPAGRLTFTAPLRRALDQLAAKGALVETGSSDRYKLTASGERMLRLARARREEVSAEAVANWEKGAPVSLGALDAIAPVAPAPSRELIDTRPHDVNYERDSIATIIASFPSEFGLRSFPGKTFRISPSASYRDDNGTAQLYTQVCNADMTWTDFAKSSPYELLREIVKPSGPHPLTTLAAHIVAAQGDVNVALANVRAESIPECRVRVERYGNGRMVSIGVSEIGPSGSWGLAGLMMHEENLHKLATAIAVYLKRRELAGKERS